MLHRELVDFSPTIGEPDEVLVMFVAPPLAPPLLFISDDVDLIRLCVISLHPLFFGAEGDARGDGNGPPPLCLFALSGDTKFLSSTELEDEDDDDEDEDGDD